MIAVKLDWCLLIAVTGTFLIVCKRRATNGCRPVYIIRPQRDNNQPTADATRGLGEGGSCLRFLSRYRPKVGAYFLMLQLLRRTPFFLFLFLLAFKKGSKENARYNRAKTSHVSARRGWIRLEEGQCENHLLFQLLGPFLRAGAPTGRQESPLVAWLPSLPATFSPI